MSKSTEFKVTFKKTRYTGLRAVGAGFYIEVKHKRKRFAIISGGTYRDESTTIQIAVEKDNGWEWKIFKIESRDQEVAKAKLIDFLPIFIKENKLHFFED